MTHRHDHCPECGVDARLVCRNPDNTPATETCPDRPLLPLRDSVERTKASNHHGVARSRSQRNRHKRGMELPRYVPCVWCGASTKLIGGAVVSGSTYCPAPDCRRAKERMDSKAKRAKAVKVRTCVICGGPAPAHGVGLTHAATCSDACRAIRYRQRVEAQSERHRAARAASPVEVPCHWCGVMLSGAGRRPGQRPCCGSAACIASRRAASRKPRPERAPAPIVVHPPVACAWCAAPLAHHGKRPHAVYPCCRDPVCISALKAEWKRRNATTATPSQP